MSKAATNALLRSHLTRVGFDLSLGRTHIYALVGLDEAIRRKSDQHPRVARSHEDYRVADSLFITGVQGLERRGLVVHHYTKDKKTGLGLMGLQYHFSVTRAGRLVIDLLKEAGMYDEYIEAFSRTESAS